MSAIESSVNLFTKICNLTEASILTHFQKVDARQTDVDTLRTTALADTIAAELDIKQTEALYSVFLYLRNRPDLEVRVGKGGGISRVNDERNKAPMTPRECALRMYDSVKECSTGTIADAFTAAEEDARKQGIAINKVRLNFQTLCTQIADKLNVKPYAVYHCLKQYIQDERKDLVVALGRQGGLMKR